MSIPVSPPGICPCLLCHSDFFLYFISLKILGILISSPSFLLEAENNILQKDCRWQKAQKTPCAFLKASALLACLPHLIVTRALRSVIFNNLTQQTIWREHTGASLKKNTSLLAVKAHIGNIQLQQNCHSLAVTAIQIKASHFPQQSKFSQAKLRKTILERERNSRSPSLSFQLPHIHALCILWLEKKGQKYTRKVF